jgi:hypothetical protein
MEDEIEAARELMARCLHEAYSVLKAEYEGCGWTWNERTLAILAASLFAALWPERRRRMDVPPFPPYVAPGLGRL